MREDTRRLLETKAKGWEIDSRGKVKIVEPIAGEPPDEYYLLGADRVGVVQIKEIKKNPEVALVGQVEYDPNRRATKSTWLLVDFRPESDRGPKHKLPADVVERELVEAGFRVGTRHEFLPDQYFLVFAAP